MGVDLFLIQDVATLIENMPLVSDNEDFTEEEQVVPKPMDVIVVDELVVSNEDGNIDEQITPFPLEITPFANHQNVTFHVFKDALANLLRS